MIKILKKVNRQLYKALTQMGAWINSKKTYGTHDYYELDSLLKIMLKKGEINKPQIHMIESILVYDRLRVRDIMVPRSNIKALCIHDSINTIIECIQQTKHSRYPVYDKHLDDIQGLFLVKDLIAHHNIHVESDILKSHIRPILHVPESKHLDSLLSDFQSAHAHMAIVIDEYGGISGLVTFENLIEQITGNIEDEFDRSFSERSMIQKTGSDTFIVDALTPIDMFNKRFDTSFSDRHFDTIGGKVSQLCGKIPQKNDLFEIGPFSGRVLHATTKQLKVFELKKKY